MLSSLITHADFKSHGPPASIIVRERETWLSDLVDTRNHLAVNDRLMGTMVRRDGWSCAPRCINSHWLLLILEGRCVGRFGSGCNSRAIELEPGSLMWIHPGIQHEQQWSATVRYAELFFGLFYPEGQHLSPPGHGLVARDIGMTQDLIEDIADEVQIDGPFAAQRLRALITSLAAQLWRVCDEISDAPTHSTSQPDRPATPVRHQGLTATQRQKLVRRIRQHDQSPPTVAQLARLVGLSPDYFTRQFGVTFGTSPRHWLVHHRMRAAAALLEQTTLAVYQIAEKIGYADVAQFSRQFKAYAGIGPARYRRSRSMNLTD